MSPSLPEHRTPIPSPMSIFVGMLLAGSLATVAFDLFGQSITPLLGFARLAPVGLANGVIETLNGAHIDGGGELLHYIAGLIGYPLGWILIARPIWRGVAPMVPEFLVAVAYGLVLWVFALYGLAHLVAGHPPFLGFTGITWVALIGHVIWAVVFVYGLRACRTWP